MHPERSSCLRLAQMADRVVKFLPYHFKRQEFCIVPPKMHGRLCIGLPKMHGHFRIGLPKVHGRLRMYPP